MTKHEIYIIVDIEASGPEPCQYALLSIGAATIQDPQETFYIELQPDSKNFIREAMDIHKLSLDDLAKTGDPPKKGLQKFENWIKKVTPNGAIPIFTAFNAPFDWMFINTYFHRYLGYNPFGHKALDIKSLYMGLHKTSFQQTSHRVINKTSALSTELSHHALEDAIHEAAIFKSLLEELSQTGGLNDNSS